MDVKLFAGCHSYPTTGDEVCGLHAMIKPDFCIGFISGSKTVSPANKQTEMCRVVSAKAE